MDAITKITLLGTDGLEVIHLLDTFGERNSPSCICGQAINSPFTLGTTTNNTKKYLDSLPKETACTSCIEILNKTRQ